MSIATHPTTYAGLDVAKATLALHLAGQQHDLPNTPTGHRRLVRLLQKQPAVQLVCEASGGYEQAPVRALWAAGITGVPFCSSWKLRPRPAPKTPPSAIDSIDWMSW